MRYCIPLLSSLMLVAFPACEEKPHPGSLPLKAVILLDVEGMQGGQNLWLAEDGTGIVQIVGPWCSGGLPEKRYRVQFGKQVVIEAERLAGVHRFLELKLKLGVGPPGGGHPRIALLSKDGKRSSSIKREHDKQADFDPFYAHLLGLTERLDGAELIYEGAFTWDWHPEGFPSFKEIQGWE
jgi:hypothetical protein